MNIKKICKICGCEFEVPHWREKTAKYCSIKCQRQSLHAKNNCVCPTCGKAFHMKLSHLKKYGHSFGNYCSRRCLNEARKELFKGERNHQYGLKGTINSSFGGKVILQKNHRLVERMVHCPNHPFCNKNGRVKEHRLVVEQHYSLFDCKYFTIIDGKYYLLPPVQVHHIDGNHSNNSISNLIPCTLKEHRAFHKSIILERDSLGRIVKTAVLKQGELLGSPEVGNQQPSQPLKKLEGSETRC